MYIWYTYDYYLSYWDIFRANHTRFDYTRFDFRPALCNESIWMVPGTVQS